MFSGLILYGLLLQPSFALEATDLRCEYLENPLGIDEPRPRLSWIVKGSQRGDRQTAYQIHLASAPEPLALDLPDLWDSGQVMSDQSIQIEDLATTFTSRQQVWWRVRLWDQLDQPGPWSEPAWWKMGLLQSEDWQAEWIGLERFATHPSGVDPLMDAYWIWTAERSQGIDAPPGERYFRRDFELPVGAQIQSAELWIRSDDRHTVWINGQPAGEDADWTKTFWYPIGQHLQPGRNHLAVAVLNGDQADNPAGVTARLRILQDDGVIIEFFTDAQWLTANSATGTAWRTLDPLTAEWTPARVLGGSATNHWPTTENIAQRLPARYLRKEFVIEKPVRRAVVYYSGVGYSELHLDGHKAGDRVLSPAQTNYNLRVSYVAEDVTTRMTQGMHALGVVLGNGRFFAPRQTNTLTFGYPRLLLQLEIEYDDGSTATIISDGSWKFTDQGPIQANNLYDGEAYDARREWPGWTEPAFDDNAWETATLVAGPTGALCSQMIEPIKVNETRQPQSISEPFPGVFIYDMGQNMVGWCRLKLQGRAGQIVRLRHAETLKPDGSLDRANLRSARQQDDYICKGDGLEIWEPRFTYHGFRYVEVTGLETTPTLDLLESRIAHDSLPVTGEWSCSNATLNRLRSNILWSTRGNYQSIPTDCPQRDERMGWLGDRARESLGESYLYRIAPLYAWWLEELSLAQHDLGELPSVAPAYWQIYPDNVTWPSLAVIVPDVLYRQYGDRRVIERHYDGLKKWAEHMWLLVEDGITESDQYGDWAVAPEDPALIHATDPSRITAPGLLATCYLYHDMQLLQGYAEMLGHGADAQLFAQRSVILRDGLNGRFFKADLNQYDNGTQTSYILPLAFGMTPEGHEEAVFQNLVNKVLNMEGGHFITGLIGCQWINQTLSRLGRPDVTYTAITRTTWPGWGYMIDQGATTMWELWNADTADQFMSSRNHTMLIGDLYSWFYETLAGIAPDAEQPGFKHIIMRPTPLGDLLWVKAAFDSPHGRIKSEWQLDPHGFNWEVEVPANATATLHIPASSRAVVTEGGLPAEDVAGIEFLRMEHDRAVYRVQSGQYHFHSMTQAGSSALWLSVCE